jgi:hypothetical protein
MNVERSFSPIEPAGGRPRQKLWGPTARYVALILVAIAAVAIYASVSRERAEHRAVASIPSDVRAALYERVLENLRFCEAHPNAGLERFCEGEAEFIVSFPECGPECQGLARRFVSVPVR